MSAKYQYVKIGGAYYGLRQSPIALAWFLTFRNRSLQLRSDFRKKKIPRIIRTLVQHQLCLGKDRAILELPVYGNLCLRVHRGYRVFNYRRNSVVRMIDPDVDQALVAGEMEGVRRASQLDFAPRILQSSVEKRWYEEDLVNGRPAYWAPRSASPVFSQIFDRDIAPCLERMIVLEAPLVANLGRYVSEIVRTIEDGRLESPGLDIERVEAVRRFAQSVGERLHLGGSGRVDLVFSHGDFSLRNILRTRNGVMAIDWESVGYRNPLFDLYNYFFTESYYKRATTSLVPEIAKAISSLQSRLMAKAPDLARTLVPLAKRYRWLYYLERIQVLLERELSSDQLDVVLRSIRVFNRYEEALARGEMGRGQRRTNVEVRGEREEWLVTAQP